jgi:hypothetical protein
MKFIDILNAADISGATRLNPGEKVALVEFMLLDESFRYRRFHSYARKLVRDSLSKRGYRQTISNMNNRLYNLEIKGFLFRDVDEELHLKPSIQKMLDMFNTGDFKIVIDLSGEIEQNNVEERILDEEGLDIKRKFRNTEIIKKEMYDAPLKDLIAAQEKKKARAERKIIKEFNI